MTNTHDETPARLKEEYPANRVVGAVDDARAAEQIVTQLSDMELDEELIDLLCNEAATEQIVAYREDHPWKAKVDHIMTFMSNESELIDHYNQMLNDGKLIVSAEVADDQQAEEVAEVMRQHGGHYINYFGSQIITTLEP